MNNKDFDQFIKKSMKDMKDDMPSDWSAMEQRLNLESDSEMSSDMEDIYLDGVVYDHLKNLQAPYEPANWDKMSARLDEEYAYRRKVIVTKSMEVLVLLLLIWTGINFFPNKKVISTPTPPVAEKQKATPIPQQLISSEKATPNTSDLTSNITTSISSSSENNLAASISYNNASTTSSKPEVNILSSNDNVLYAYESFPIENEKSAISDVSSISSRTIVLDQTTSDKTTTIEISNSLTDQDETKKVGILKRTILAIISPLKSNNPSELKSEETEKAKRVDLEKMLALRKAKPKGLMVSMFGSSDFNHISTPHFDEVTGKSDAIRRNNIGYGGGITLAFHAKKLLVETGLVYHFIKYQQVPNTLQFGSFNRGYFEQKWEEAEINLVQIPLHLQYSLYQRKRWNIYGLAGASLNVAAKNIFAFQETDLSATGQRSPNNSVGKTISEQAPNYNGLLEGGDLTTNSYITANFGFGLERYFSYRWSMFIQPVYRYNFFLDGVGPENDLLHSGSIQIGTKVRLRK